VPVTDKVITDADSGIQTGMLKPFTALKTTLKGNYDKLEEAWTTAMKHIADNGIKEVPTNPYLEVYQTDPMTVVNPADWITEIYIPVEDNN
jgi:effector-binding domain-containing protein